MADFSDRCIPQEYDCNCYAEKVKEYFKTDEAYIKYWKKEDAIMPSELINMLGECSLDEEFKF